MVTVVDDRFDDETTGTTWRVTQIGRGVVQTLPGALWLTVKPASETMYSDAQISDYGNYTDDFYAPFRWRPPLQMTVRARAKMSAGSIQGTAGFGFWNQPFMPGQRRFRIPQAVWFFYSSPPSNMQLARGVPGPGWKAATFNARRWPFFALLPTAPLGFLLLRFPTVYERLWPLAQQALGVSEGLLEGDLLTRTHTYTLDWAVDSVRFAVDGERVHETDLSPGGPLGFIAWVDNQYAVVTPQGQFGFGLVPVAQEQSLVLEQVTIRQL